MNSRRNSGKNKCFFFQESFPYKVTSDCSSVINKDRVKMHLHLQFKSQFLILYLNLCLLLPPLLQALFYVYFFSSSSLLIHSAHMIYYYFLLSLVLISSSSLEKNSRSFNVFLNFNFTAFRLTLNILPLISIYVENRPNVQNILKGNLYFFPSDQC